MLIEVQMLNLALQPLFRQTLVSGSFSFSFYQFHFSCRLNLKSHFFAPFAIVPVRIS